MPSILLVDDDPGLLNDLEAQTHAVLNGEGEILKWQPTGDDDPLAVYSRLVDSETLLVVTDYDLTGKGRTGLFGTAVVGWCQARFIPVGDFSRSPNALPSEPNLFELRVPTQPDQAAKFIVGVFRGFKQIRSKLKENMDLFASKRNPAAVLADLLEAPEMEGQFALYSARLGTTSAALMEKITKGGAPDTKLEPEGKAEIVSYVVGHMLLNSILRFPGPILSSRALAAYVGTSDSDIEAVSAVFNDAAYSGPFSQLERYFWRSKVESKLYELNPLGSGDGSVETIGEVNRVAIEKHLGRKLKRHGCSRCEGLNGGFLCPFTGRVVCQKQDCSVGSNSWIPRGAVVCRIEREFYEEWAPILGI